MVSAGVRSNALALLLLINCLLLLQLFYGGFVFFSLFCCALFNVVSSFAVTSLGKRELVAYFNCLLMLCDCWCFDMCLFFTVPWVCLQPVIVPFSGHTHLPFLSK